MKRIAFGFLGNNLDDRGRSPKRWQRWRPTIDLCRQQQFPIDRLELIYQQEDESLARQLVEDIDLLNQGIEVRLTALKINDPWDFEEVYTSLLDIIKSHTFDLEEENYVVHITTGTHVVQICWFLLAEARFLPAKLIQMSPPHRPYEMGKIRIKGQELLQLPVGVSNLVDLDLNQYDAILSRFYQQASRASDFLKSGIATRNHIFNQMIAEIECVAIRSRAPILIQGATGVGKSYLAKKIYELKRAQNLLSGPFVAVNCATLRGDSAMSTLFGHSRGAFTGADQDRAGLLLSANQGLLFLDEIAELGADEQAMLLRAIEEKQFLPLGRDKEVSSDFQLIAGTNRDLRQAVEKGQFREDLYARINLWTYYLPALHQRPEDIEPNIEFEINRYTQEYGVVPRFQKQALKNYLNFAQSAEALWSGNFRDLNASIIRMATLSNQGVITQEVVNDEIERLLRLWTGDPKPLSINIPQQIDLFDKLQLESVLAVCQQSSSLSEAGRKLFAYSRTQKQKSNDADRLRKYLAKFDLSWAQIKGE